jgi:hypothetical protein
MSETNTQTVEEKLMSTMEKIEKNLTPKQEGFFNKPVVKSTLVWGGAVVGLLGMSFLSVMATGAGCAASDKAFGTNFRGKKLGE